MRLSGRAPIRVAVAAAAVGAIVAPPVPASAQPDQPLIGFSLQHPPVMKWRVTADQLGIPATVGVGEATAFATSGRHAYFKTICNTSHCLDNPEQWVFGIDLADGRRLFTPFRLADATATTSCYQTGDHTAVCFDDYQPDQEWTLDLARGKITAHGPTNLHGASGGPDRYMFFTLGGRLLAGQDDRGIHGIDNHGHRTWFAPGNGWPVTTDASVLTQLPNEDDPVWRVFSVDGTELTPSAPDGLTLRRATAYPGGFAYQYDGADEIGVLFYDTTGRLLVRRPLPGYNLADGIGIPIAFDGRVFHVFAADGTPTAQIPAGPLGISTAPRFHKIGDRLLYWSGVGEDWQLWDLTTGKPASPCTIPLGGVYDWLGSDGAVAVVNQGNHLVAVELAACRRLWELPANGLHQFQAVGSALLSGSIDGEIVGLGPPG